MYFLFMPPFSQEVGERFEIALKESCPLKTLLPKLPPKILAMASGEAKIEDDAFGAHFLFFRQGRVLKIEEIIACDDEVRVMLPVVGG